MSRIFFFFILIFGLCTSALAQQIQDTGYEAEIPLYDENRELGDIKVRILGDSIVWVDKNSLLSILKNALKEDTLKSLEKLPDELKPSMLPFPLKLNAQELRVETKLELEIRSSEKIDLRTDFEKQKEAALHPSPFGGAMNYRIEKNWGADRLGGENFNGQFNTFVNMNSFVLENQMYYQSNIDQKWIRSDTRIVKDFEKQQIRSQIGDVYPLVQGFMQAKPMGGVNIQRNFSLNPYRLPFPTGSQNFALRARSLVKYFVNGALVKTEYLPAGNYTAKDIPLNNGLNTILIEATDDLGVKQTFIFRTSASINLLNRGESRFDLSYGTPFQDTANKRTYIEKDGKLFSGFYQYGFSSIFSGSAYMQSQSDFNLLGAEIIQATTIGNFNLGHAESRDKVSHGGANSLFYQYVSQGVRWFDSHSIGLRYENRSEEFKSGLLDQFSKLKDTYAATYTLPVASVMTMSVGGNYGNVRDNALADRYGYDMTLNIRVLQHHNLSFYMGRTRDENKQWNDVGYVFLTITFPESNNFLSALYDKESKTSRLTYLRDSQNKLYNPRIQGTAEHTEYNHQQGEVDVNYPTPFADFGGRITGQHDLQQQDQYARGSVRLNSAFVFAYQDKEWGAGLSRPIPGSFVIFKPKGNLKSQKIGLKSTSPYTEAETGLFDEITFSNLLAYQYRDIQLDPSFLDEGTTLVREKFTLYPTYRSAHLITLEERGHIMLKGRMLNADGSPVSLQVGHVGDQTFFTNRDGFFFVEGVEPGKYGIAIEGRDQSFPIVIPKDARGVKDIGLFNFEAEP